MDGCLGCIEKQDHIDSLLREKNHLERRNENLWQAVDEALVRLKRVH